MSDYEDEDGGPAESHMDSKALRQQAGKRAPSAYNVFVRLKYQERKNSDLPPISFTEYARTVGQLWTNLPDDEKENYRKLSKDQASLPREETKGTEKVNRRPVSAYNLFVRASYKERDESKNIPTTSFNRLVGKMWAELPNAEKDVYAQQARELEAHVKVMLNEGKGDELAAEDRDGGTDGYTVPGTMSINDLGDGLHVPTTISTHFRTPVVSVAGVGAMSEYFMTGLNAGTARRQLPMPKQPRSGSSAGVAGAVGEVADRVIERLTQQQAFSSAKTWDTASAARPFSKRKYVATRYLRNQCYMAELFDHNLSDITGSGYTPSPELASSTMALIESQISRTRDESGALQVENSKRVATRKQQGATFAAGVGAAVPPGKGIDFLADPNATPRAVKRSRTEFKGRAPAMEDSDIQSMS